MANVLLIEDDSAVASSLQRVLEFEGFTVETAGSAQEGLAAAKEGDFHVVVTDLQMPGTDGLEVIGSLHEMNPHLPVILMTAHHSTETAIKATKRGAYDYILKPIDQVEFQAMLQKAIASNRLMSEQVELGEATFTKDAIVGKSRAMQNIYKEIGRVAGKPVTVLIRGETGTGKELVARALYHHSDRADQPFIVVNCVAIPENLLESELFGHEAGAFTDAKVRRIGKFEQANHGTIFLDEIGDMTPGTQAKLLRVLQDKTLQRLGGKERIEVDVRIIAATHRDLESAIQGKEFREDLFYRLNVAVIHLPPLRERSEDIPILINYFLHRHGADLAAPNATMTAEAVEYLQHQPWLGNVRELENAIRKALLLSRGYTITLETMQTALSQTVQPRPATDPSFSTYVAELLARAKSGELENVQAVFNETVERELYGQAIRLAKGDQTKAARWLGVSRPTIREKLLRYGLHPTKDGE